MSLKVVNLDLDQLEGEEEDGSDWAMMNQISEGVRKITYNHTHRVSPFSSWRIRLEAHVLANDRSLLSVSVFARKGSTTVSFTGQKFELDRALFNVSGVMLHTSEGIKTFVREKSISR